MFAQFGCPGKTGGLAPAVSVTSLVPASEYEPVPTQVVHQNWSPSPVQGHVLVVVVEAEAELLAHRLAANVSSSAIHSDRQCK